MVTIPVYHMVTSLKNSNALTMNTSTLSAAAINGDESKMPLCDAAASHPEDSTESGDIPGISINQDTDGISMTLDNRQTTSETQRGKESLQGKSPFS